jgi:hypothetical protein
LPHPATFEPAQWEGPQRPLSWRGAPIMAGILMAVLPCGLASNACPLRITRTDRPSIIIFLISLALVPTDPSRPRFPTATPRCWTATPRTLPASSPVNVYVD